MRVGTRAGENRAARDELLRRLHAAGLSTPVIAQRVGRSVSVVRDDLRRLGLSRAAAKEEGRS